MQSKFLWVTLAISLALAACGTLEVGFESTPVPVVPTLTSAPASQPTAAPTALPSETPAAAPTTSPPGFACAFAYSNDTQLYCLGEGGAPIPIADASTQGTVSDPLISPDGAWVAYLVNMLDGTSQLWAVDVSGLTGNDGLNQPRRLLVGPDQISSGQPEVINSPMSPQWQAGTHTLFFSTRFTQHGGNQGPGEYVNADLWKVDADTGAVTNILARQSAGRFALSPDGQFLALSNPQSIALARSDGVDFRLLLEFPFIVTYSEYAYKPAAAWSPDSAFFNVAIPSADPMAADASATLYRMHVDGKVETLMTLTGNFLFGGQPPITFSPNGRFAVYGQFNQATQAADLHLLTLEAQSDTVIGQANGLNGLAWSPDSNHYVYGVAPAGGGFVAGLEGPPQAFAPGMEVIGAAWADDLGFYFYGIVDGQWGLYFSSRKTHLQASHGVQSALILCPEFRAEAAL